MNVSTHKSIKPSVIPELIKLIEKIPYGEQQVLLRELEDRFANLQRKHVRKEICTEVECLTHYQSIKGHMLMIATMEPFEDRGYGTTSGSGFWSHSMIGVMAPLHDRHYGTTPGSGLWRHKYPFSKQ